MNRTPATLLAPLDRVYDESRQYLGLLSEDGIIVDHEEVTLLFAYREALKVAANRWFYVDNPDHIA